MVVRAKRQAAPVGSRVQQEAIVGLAIGVLIDKGMLRQERRVVESGGLGLCGGVCCARRG